MEEKKNETQTNTTAKILITQDLDPMEESAISMVTKNVAKGLIAIGYQVTMASPNTEKNTTVKNITVLKLETDVVLEEAISNADCVLAIFNFSSEFKPLATSVADICNNLGKPFVPWFHTTDVNAKFNKFEGTSDFNQSLNLRRIKDSMNSDTCKKIICVSEAVKTSVVNLGVSEKKVRVVYNGLDLFKPEYKTKSNTPKKYDALYVGRLSREKGILFFLSAVNLVKEVSPNIQVGIVGTGPEEARMDSFIKALDLEDNIVKISKLENGDLLSEIKKAKCVVNTSITESFGLVIAEAMALGIPVVAPAIEGPMEILESGKLGELFTPGNTSEIAEKILLCQSMTDQINKRTKLAKEKALNEFSLVKQVKALEQVLSEVLE